MERPGAPTRTAGGAVTRADYSRWACSEQKRQEATEMERQKEYRSRQKEQRAKKWAQYGADLANKGKNRQEKIKKSVDSHRAAIKEQAHSIRQNSLALDEVKLRQVEQYTDRAAMRAQAHYKANNEAHRRRHQELRQNAQERRRQSEAQTKMLDAMAHEKHEEYAEEKRLLTERVRLECSPEHLRSAQRIAYAQRHALASKTRQEAVESRERRAEHFHRFLEETAPSRQQSLASHERAKKAHVEQLQHNHDAAEQMRHEKRYTRASLDALRHRQVLERQAMHDEVLSRKFAGGGDGGKAAHAAAVLSPQNHRTFRFRSRRGERPQDVQEVRL